MDESRRYVLETAFQIDPIVAPIWFLAASYIYEKDMEDTAWAKSVFPLLLKNYRWFCEHRRNNNFTFSWGTDNEDKSELILLKGKVGAVYESGLDDSPMFDCMQLRSSCLDHACVDLSSLIYCACEILKQFAVLLGENMETLSEDEARYADALHSFFDPGQKAFSSYHLETHRFVTELTPCSFYPLLTSHVTKAEIDACAELVLSEKFKHNQLIPSLMYSSRFLNADGDYWRGRIWPPQVWLTCRGFKRHKHPVYSVLRECSEAMFMKEWARHGHVHENYSGTTGFGEAQEYVYARTCPMYSWGGLLGVL
mmetsp:Transcript_10573/g.17305  ORF Transcript_10573/g.17305 Transcript_10573/m.17305 type:complete len:310 (+) Transcript_10573:799-1728(+)